MGFPSLASLPVSCSPWRQDPAVLPVRSEGLRGLRCPAAPRPPRREDARPARPTAAATLRGVQETLRQQQAAGAPRSLTGSPRGKYRNNLAVPSHSALGGVVYTQVPVPTSCPPTVLSHPVAPRRPLGPHPGSQPTSPLRSGLCPSRASSESYTQFTLSDLHILLLLVRNREIHEDTHAQNFSCWKFMGLSG